MSEAVGITCMLMRGGTSKGAYFVARDLPADPAERDDLLLRIMGTPDARQIDGLGGATPLTSKVAIVSVSSDDDADLDYLFLQLGTEQATVTTTQTCGNLLAGVGPFAIERGLVPPDARETTLRIRLINTGDVATARIQTPGGIVTYAGDTAIDGVPGAAAPIELEVERSVPLLPTGNVTDRVGDHDVTIVDGGMPVVVLRAEDFGISGDESPESLEGNDALVAEIERVRLLAGPLFGLGDVREQSVPKMMLTSPPREGGAVTVRAFIPHRVHTSIGVLMAASVAAAARIPGTLAADIASVAEADARDAAPFVVEHPSGTLPTHVAVERGTDGLWHGTSASTRTARKLFDGTVFPRPGGPAPEPLQAGDTHAPGPLPTEPTASTADDGPRG